MRILTAAIAIAAFAQVAAVPVADGQPASPGAATDSPTGGAATQDRDAYTQKAQADVKQWRQKLDDFSAAAKAKGQQVGVAAERDLKSAWARTEADARNLRTASAKGWDSAKRSYERASHELADAWDKARHKAD